MASRALLKLERYRLYGVAEYWVIDPDERTVEVWKLAEHAESPLVLSPDATLERVPESGTILAIDLTELFEA